MWDSVGGCFKYALLTWLWLSKKFWHYVFPKNYIWKHFCDQLCSILHSNSCFIVSLFFASFTDQLLHIEFSLYSLNFLSYIFFLHHALHPFSRCHIIWIYLIYLILPLSTFSISFHISFHILFPCHPPFSLTFDWVINHSVHLKELGALSHGLCDLEILAAFFTWLALWQRSSHQPWPSEVNTFLLATLLTNFMHCRNAIIPWGIRLFLMGWIWLGSVFYIKNINILHSEKVILLTEVLRNWIT